MQIISPLAITDTILTSSNVPETDAAAYNAGTTYADGATVIYEHNVYESLVGSNLGNQPDISLTDWLLLGATNRFKAFDQKISDAVVYADTITYSLDPGVNIDSIVFFGLTAAEVNITITDPTDGEVYNETRSTLSNISVVDWYTYFFGAPTTFEREVVFQDLPPYSSATIVITITNTGSNAEVGQLVLGSAVSLGLTTYGSSISIQDYSRKERDAFGNPIIIERAFARLVDFNVQLSTSDVRRVDRELASYRTTPIVWIGVPEEEYGLVVYGYYRQFDILLSNVSISDATIEVEGLI